MAWTAEKYRDYLEERRPLIGMNPVTGNIAVDANPWRWVRFIVLVLGIVGSLLALAVLLSLQ